MKEIINEDQAILMKKLWGIMKKDGLFTESDIELGKKIADRLSDLRKNELNYDLSEFKEKKTLEHYYRNPLLLAITKGEKWFSFADYLVEKKYVSQLVFYRDDTIKVSILYRIANLLLNNNDKNYDKDTLMRLFYKIVVSDRDYFDVVADLKEDMEEAKSFVGLLTAKINGIEDIIKNKDYKKLLLLTQFFCFNKIGDSKPEAIKKLIQLFCDKVKSLHNVFYDLYEKKESLAEEDIEILSSFMRSGYTITAIDDRSVIQKLSETTINELISASKLSGNDSAIKNITSCSQPCSPLYSTEASSVGSESEACSLRTSIRSSLSDIYTVRTAWSETEKSIDFTRKSSLSSMASIGESSDTDSIKHDSKKNKLALGKFKKVIQSSKIPLFFKRKNKVTPITTQSETNVAQDNRVRS